MLHWLPTVPALVRSILHPVVTFEICPGYHYHVDLLCWCMCSALGYPKPYPNPASPQGPSPWAFSAAWLHIGSSTIGSQDPGDREGVSFAQHPLVEVQTCGKARSTYSSFGSLRSVTLAKELSPGTQKKRLGLCCFVLQATFIPSSFSFRGRAMVILSLTMLSCESSARPELRRRVLIEMENERARNSNNSSHSSSQCAPLLHASVASPLPEAARDTRRCKVSK